MELLFETITETQKYSLEAAASFSDTCLIVVERLTQLNIEVARTAFEKSAEMALLCWDRSLAKEHACSWYASVQPSLEHLSEYLQNFHSITLEVAKH